MSITKEVVMVVKIPEILYDDFLTELEKTGKVDIIQLNEIDMKGKTIQLEKRDG